MAINWMDNKVFNPNAPQRNTIVNNPVTRTAPEFTEDSIPMEKYTNNPNKMNENMTANRMNENMMDNRMNENMMDNRMNEKMMDNRMNDNMMDNRMNDNMMNNRMMNENQFMNDMMTRQGPPPVMNVEYIAGFLKQNIGRNVRAEFPMAGGFYIDKAGILREVGVNYFVLEDYISHARILCDLYSVRFVTIL